MDIWKLKKITYDKTIRRIRPLHRFIRWLVFSLSKGMLIFISKVTKFEITMGRDIAPYFLFFWFTRYEQEIITLYTQILRPGMKVVDIGANIGYHTIRFAQLVGPKGKVFAFEPHPYTCGVLLRNIRRRALENVVVEQKVVSDTCGVLNLYLGHHEARDSIVKISNTYIKVENVCLDEYFSGYQDNIHLVKIDVEGAELKVLRGMRSLMNQSPSMTLILEFCPRLLRMAENEEAPMTLLNLLCESSFYLYGIRKDGKLIPLEKYSSFEEFISSVRTHTNLLACRNPW